MSGEQLFKVGKSTDLTNKKIKTASLSINETIAENDKLNMQSTMTSTLVSNSKKPYSGKKRGRKPKTEEEKLLKKQKQTSDSRGSLFTNTSVPGLPINSLPSNGTFKTEIDSSGTNKNTSNSETADNTNQKALAHLYHRREFVCDRCSKLRRACFGMLESCNNCLIANKKCTLDRPRIRKSKPRQLKVMEMAIPIGENVNINTIQTSHQINAQEASKAKQLQLVINNLQAELKESSKEKKIREEYYKELEIENEYLKDSVSTLQQLFKEQQNLVQLLEEQQLLNFQKLKKLQSNKMAPNNVLSKSMTAQANPQFQLHSDDRKDWLLQINNNVSIETPISSDSQLNNHSYSAQISDNSNTKNVSPQNSTLKNPDSMQNKINHEQLQLQLKKLVGKNEEDSQFMATTWSDETSVETNKNTKTISSSAVKNGGFLQNSDGNAGWIVSQFISEPTTLNEEGAASKPKPSETSNTKTKANSNNDVDLYMII